MNNVVTFALRHTSITLFPHPGCSNNTYENHTVHGYFQSLHTMLIYNSTLMHFPNLTSLGYNSSLNILRIRESRLSSVPCFPDEFRLQHLATLDLRGNRINYFCNMNFAPNIRHLFLYTNWLSDILFTESTNVPLSNLYFFQIKKNKIDFVSDLALRVIPNCGRLQMGSNKITRFPNLKIIASSVELINLYKNKIPNVPCMALDKMKKLTSLYLESNVITYVCPALLSLMPKLTILDLSWNHLLEISDLRFPIRMQPTRMLLNDNPFRCLPSMCWMLFVSQDSNLQLKLDKTLCLYSDDIEKEMLTGINMGCRCEFLLFPK